VQGGIAVTQLDSLDMLLLVNDPDGFVEAVQRIERHVFFNVSSRVHVFETTIRYCGVSTCTRALLAEVHSKQIELTVTEHAIYRHIVNGSAMWLPRCCSN
jgi:hypothetical protein